MADEASELVAVAPIATEPSTEPTEPLKKPRKRYSGSFLALARPDLANKILRGRPSKINKDTIMEIVSAVEAGTTFGSAATAAGIAPDTANRWIQRGNEDRENGKSSDYSLFVELLTRAQAKGETTHARYLATNEDWRARAFILERRYADWRKQDVATSVTNVVVSDQLVAQLVDSLRVAKASQELVNAIETTAVAIKDE